MGIKGLGPVASMKNGPALPLGAKGGVPKGTHKTPSVRQARVLGIVVAILLHNSHSLLAESA